MTTTPGHAEEDSSHPSRSAETQLERVEGGSQLGGQPIDNDDDNGDVNDDDGHDHNFNHKLKGEGVIFEADLPWSLIL